MLWEVQNSQDRSHVFNLTTQRHILVEKKIPEAATLLPAFEHTKNVSEKKKFFCSKAISEAI